MDTLTRVIGDDRGVAVVCMEMQRGVVGDLADHPAADAVRSTDLVERLASVLAAARDRGSPVVHCTASFRRDRAGSFRNMPAIERLLDNPEHLVVGSPATEVIPELLAPTDIESPRHHGISPFTGTSLDTLLRSLGVQTVIAAGVSLNRGIVGLTIEAVNRGYDVAIPRDCVAGYPASYGELVLANTLDAISTLTTSDELLRVWASV